MILLFLEKPFVSVIQTEILTDTQIPDMQRCDRLIVKISDNGKGIPASKISFLFEKFYRLPNTKVGGSGLGLSIVKGFIEAHHGNVKAENNKNDGVTFTIEFPAEASYLNNLRNE